MLIQKEREIMDYTYDERTTLANLLSQFERKEGLSEQEAADKIGVTVVSYRSWKLSEPRQALLTKYKAAFENATNIDLGRLLVILAKRKILKERPELEGIVTFERFKTREDLIEEIKKFQERYRGVSRFVARQLGTPDQVTNHWVNSGRSHPSGEYLELCIIGLSKGLVDASREDIKFILICRNIFGCDPQHVFPDVSDFGSALKKFGSYFDNFNRAASVIAMQTDFDNAERIKDLMRWSPEKPKKFVSGTMTKVLRVIVKNERPDLLDIFEEKVLEILANEDFVETPIFIDGVVTEPEEIEAQEAEPAKIRSEPPIRFVSAEDAREDKKVSDEPVDPSADSTVTTILIDVLEGALSSLKAQAKREQAQKEKERPAKRASATDVVGETLGEIRHCLTRASFNPQPGQRLTKEQVTDIKLCIVFLRKILVTVAELDSEHVREIMDVLGPELDELYLSGRIKIFENVLAVWSLIEAERSTTNMKRKGMQNGS